MPQNKRESLIFTVIMCFLMVLFMSIYNVSLQMGEVSITAIEHAWLGLPIAYCIAICLDLFVVSKLAKGFAFGFLVKPDDPSTLKKVLAVSCCMVVPMVIFMSFFGAVESAIRMGSASGLIMTWLHNIPMNFIAALPYQLLIAGPITRKVFRTAFPVGKVLA